MRLSCQRSRDEIFGVDIGTVAQDVRTIRNAVHDLVQEHYNNAVCELGLSVVVGAKENSRRRRWNRHSRDPNMMAMMPQSMRMGNTTNNELYGAPPPAW
jgi:hypothetical protein